jgi:hypothetical protein
MSRKENISKSAAAFLAYCMAAFGAGILAAMVLATGRGM